MNISSSDFETADIVDGDARLVLAIDALDAVRDLLCEASNGQSIPNMTHVDPDHFASLLGLIVNEMRSAHGATFPMRSRS